jgi:DegV family protein with EDD domain
MPRVAVVTDSTADLPSGMAEDLAIRVVPLNVHWEGATYRDKIDLSADEFYRRLAEARELPKTSAPAVGLFEETYQELLAEHKGIVSVHISARLSGTCSAALAAAQSVAPERIVVIDSRQLSLCLGWLAVEAARLARQDAPLAAVAEHVRRLLPRVNLYAALDTLEFLQRGGRIGRAQALIGSLLSVKPIVQIQDGEVAPVDRVRTRAAALRRLVELTTSLPPVQALGVLHGAAPEQAATLRDELAARFPGQQIVTSEIGAVIGTHAGPGVYGVAYLLAE